MIETFGILLYLREPAVSEVVITAASGRQNTPQDTALSLYSRYLIGTCMWGWNYGHSSRWVIQVAPLPVAHEIAKRGRGSCW